MHNATYHNHQIISSPSPSAVLCIRTYLCWYAQVQPQAVWSDADTHTHKLTTMPQTLWNEAVLCVYMKMTRGHLCYHGDVARIGPRGMSHTDLYTTTANITQSLLPPTQPNAGTCVGKLIKGTFPKRVTAESFLGRQPSKHPITGRQNGYNMKAIPML